jgi:hypothetical protein
MAGIKVVAALVRCAADLLICNDIDTARLRFADAENCRNVLPAIIGELQRRGARDEVVMGRCRFMTDNAPDKPGIGIDVVAALDLIAPSASPATVSEPRRRAAPDQAALGRCRIADGGPAPTTDSAQGSITRPAPPAIAGEPQRRGAPDRCRIPDSVDVAAAGGAIAPSAP